MSNSQRIKDLYFKDGLKQVEIAKKLGISKNTVSKTLKNTNEYIEEKELRKRKSRERHSKNTQKIIKQQREKVKLKKDEDDLILRKMHNQASMELSKNNKLSDMAYRDWNTSAYKYNSAKKRFEFREELGRSYDVKKFLKGSI